MSRWPAVLATVQERDNAYLRQAATTCRATAPLDASGRNVGFDIDLCRAVAAAVLGDPEKIQITLITAAERGPTIQSGEVDLLVRTVTWTTSRDAQWGNYVHTTFYDGQGFMVPKSLGVSSASELGGASVCVTGRHHDRAEHGRLSSGRTTWSTTPRCSRTPTWCLTPTRKASARSSRTTDRSWRRCAAHCRTRMST